MLARRRRPAGGLPGATSDMDRQSGGLGLGQLLVLAAALLTALGFDALLVALFGPDLFHSPDPEVPTCTATGGL